MTRRLQPRAAREELGRHGRRSGDLLEVVEHEQHLALAQAVRDIVDERPIRRLANPDHPAQRDQHSLGVGRGREVHERHPVAEPVGDLAGSPDGQAGLAGPAGAGQRHQAHVPVGESLLDRGQLGAPADERSNLGRQAAGKVVEGRERRERVVQRRVDQLEHPLRAAEILEPVLPEIPQRGVVGRVLTHERDGRGREQDLAAVPGGHEPCGAVDRRAEVVVAAALRPAHVQPHPDTERTGLAPRLGGEAALGGETGRHPPGGVREDRHEPIAGGLDHLSAGGGDRRLQDGVMPGKRPAHRLGHLLPEPGAARDVSEQERERAVGLQGRGAVHALTIVGFAADVRSVPAQRSR